MHGKLDEKPQVILVGTHADKAPNMRRGMYIICLFITLSNGISVHSIIGIILHLVIDHVTLKVMGILGRNSITNYRH